MYINNENNNVYNNDINGYLMYINNEKEFLKSSCAMIIINK